jgi:hypothetical protein
MSAVPSLLFLLQSHGTSVACSSQHKASGTNKVCDVVIKPKGQTDYIWEGGATMRNRVRESGKTAAGNKRGVRLQ